MEVFLVRHGESAANIDRTVSLTVPDHAIPLSDLGHQQAAEAGGRLAAYIRNHPLEAKLDYVPYTRVWASPYKRARDTAHHIMNGLRIGGLTADYREHINLCEQQFGLFDGIADEDLPVRMPVEYAHYKKCEDYEGRFWARMPMGESRFDVAVRVHQAFGTFLRDAQKHKIGRIIVVCHGVTLRAFVMQWLHYPYEWFDTERNPHNCAIRHLVNGEDRGYLLQEGYNLPDNPYREYKVP